MAWLKIMAGEVSQFMTVMQADNFLGSYEFVHKMYKPYGMDSGDFSLHVDKETKKAYFFFERPHFELITATLNDTYTEVSEEYSEHYVDLLPPYTRETPTYFERKNTKKATYVWLPIEWEGDKPVIRWKDEWRWEEIR